MCVRVTVFLKLLWRSKSLGLSILIFGGKGSADFYCGALRLIIPRLLFPAVKLEVTFAIASRTAFYEFGPFQAPDYTRLNPQLSQSGHVLAGHNAHLLWLSVHAVVLLAEKIDIHLGRLGLPKGIDTRRLKYIAAIPLD